MNRPEPFYLLDTEKIHNPFPEYAYYREHEPIFFCEPINLWFAFKYEVVKALFKDERLSSKRVGSFLSFAPKHLQDDMLQCQKLFEETMIMQDGQAHRRLRQAFNHGFTPKVVQATEELIHQVAEELIAKVKEQGYMDFAQDYAHILPVAVICHLLGDACIKMAKENKIDTIILGSVRLSEMTEPLRKYLNKRNVKITIIEPFSTCIHFAEALLNQFKVAEGKLVVLSSNESTLNILLLQSTPLCPEGLRHLKR